MKYKPETKHITLFRWRFVFLDGKYMGKYQWKEKRGQETHELDPKV